MMIMIMIPYDGGDGDDFDVAPTFDEVWRVYVHTKDMLQTGTYQDRFGGDRGMPINVLPI